MIKVAFGISNLLSAVSKKYRRKVLKDFLTGAAEEDQSFWRAANLASMTSDLRPAQLRTLLQAAASGYADDANDSIGRGGKDAPVSLAFGSQVPYELQQLGESMSPSSVEYTGHMQANAPKGKDVNSSGLFLADIHAANTKLQELVEARRAELGWWDRTFSDKASPNTLMRDKNINEQVQGLMKSHILGYTPQGTDADVLRKIYGATSKDYAKAVAEAGGGKDKPYQGVVELIDASKNIDKQLAAATKRIAKHKL